MVVSKENKYERGDSRDGQFEVWKLSRISEERKSSVYTQGFRQTSPMRLDDIDELLDGMMIQDFSTPRKMRSLHLSIKQTRILATLLPNAIINIPELKKERFDTFVGVLLFADVSGFTALCEKYNGFGKSGSDKLTATLNNYLGAMVEVIYNNGGDVLKFSGDALLALWKLDRNQYMYSLIHKVICCALYIQNSMGVYETDVKVLLRVKLAISAGNMMFCVIGDDNSRHYLVVGSPVYEVKSAEQVCTSGDVVLSFSAWGHLSPVNYEHYWKDDEHVKIVRVIYNPESSKREILRTQTNFKSDSPRYNFFRKDSPKRKVGASSSIFHVREDAMKTELCSELRTFLIPSVIQQIDADLPMEYLSEMRNVTVMFINIIPNKLNARKIITMVDEAYITICGLAYKAKGSVNKVSLFDKDVMVLVIFGLRGFNHEGEAASSLKCGFDIRQACCNLDGVLSVSVGVTTGQAYCGVVGHPLRREYTVMGAVVNKAARIMCAYPDMVTCDNDTFLFSNLPASFFRLQEKRHLKGIEDTGPIYEFTLEKSKNTMAAMDTGVYPILGREEEIRMFQSVLKTISETNTLYKAVLVTGPARIGKTRLLDEMILEAQKNGVPTAAITLHPVHSTLPYGAVRCIIRQILDIPDSASKGERERKLSLVLRNHAPASDYWHLNDVMNVQFPQDSDGNDDDDARLDSKFEKIKSLFHIILTMGTKNVLFAIDDVDFCDEMSWRLLVSVIDSRLKFLVMTVAKHFRRGLAKQINFPLELDHRILKLTLLGLSDLHLAALACQILNAKAVPPEVVRVLTARSNGNPGWCESFLLSHSQSNVLKVEYIAERLVKKLGLIMPPESDLERKHYRAFSRRSDPLEDGVKEAILSDGKEQIHGGSTSNYGEENVSAGKLKFMLNVNGTNKVIGADKKYRKNVHIEEAYQDLIQRLQMIRSRDQLRFFHASAEVLTQDFDRAAGEAYDEADEAADDERKDQEIVLTKQDLGIGLNGPQVRLVGAEEGEPDRTNLESRSDDSLNEKVNEIRERFLATRYRGTGEDLKLDRKPGDISAVRSFVSPAERGGAEVLPRSMSAGSLVNRREHFCHRPVAPDSECYMMADDNLEFLPSALWKPYVQDLMDQSVKMFVRMKAKPNMKKFSSRRSRDKSLIGSESFFSSVSLTSASLSSAEVHSQSLRQETSEPRTSRQESAEPGIDQQPVSSKGKDIHNISKTLSFAEEEYFKSRRSLSELKTLTSVPSMATGVSDSLQENEVHVVRDDEMTYPPIPTSLHTIFMDTILSKMEVNKPEASGPEASGKRRWVERLCKCMRRCDSSGATSELSVDLPDEREGDRDVIPAILVSPNVNLEEITPENFAGVVMSAFDCLRPYEQLMLKCGSIIGEKFTRKMLNAIMHDPNPILTAEAVKRLFEMRILVCGLYSGNSDDPVEVCKCACPLTADEIFDETLPPYSFCRVLLFRYAMFRSTLYALIPLDQKREFHIRAVQFLEAGKIICSSCESQIGVDHKFTTEILSELEARSASEEGQVKRNISARTEKQAKKKGLSPLTIPSVLPNFQNCECLVLQADIHKQLINHCIAAGLKDKEIEFLISYISIVTSLGEHEEARLLLGDAEVLVKSPGSNPLQDGKEQKIFLGRIYLLQGCLQLELGELKKARYYLLMSLKYFGSIIRPFTLCPVLLYWIVFLEHRNHPLPTRLEAKFCRLPDGLQGKWNQARVAALRSLNILRTKSNNLIELCNAYSNAIDIYRHFGDFKFCRALESAAARDCTRLATYKTAIELIAIGRLNCSVLNARMISGYLLAASELGETVVSISDSISYSQAELYIIPKVVQTMMMIGKLNRAAKLINHLPSEDVWHDILSLEFILETGYVIKSSEICLNGIWNSLHSGQAMDVDVQRRAISVVYVWMTRLGKLEEAEMWYKQLPQSSHSLMRGDTANNMFTELKLLEGDLLLLNILRENDSPRNQLNDKVVASMKSLIKLTKRAAVMLPRLLHLRAYYIYRTRNLSQALEILNKAKKISNEQRNLLERVWISHSKKVWKKKSNFDVNYWTEAAESGKLMEWATSHNLNSCKNFMYSLK